MEALSFEEELQERWAAEALRWLLQASSRHLAARSHQVLSLSSYYQPISHLGHTMLPNKRVLSELTRAEQLVMLLLQVYRALRPAANGEACVSLLSCLHMCLISPSPTSLHTAVEVCLTLKVLPLIARPSTLLQRCSIATV